MKTLKRTTVFLIAATIITLTSSCKKLEDALGVPSMTCYIDGEKWDALLPVAKIETGQLIIGSTAGSKSKVGGQLIVTTSSTSTGEYDFSDGSTVVYMKSSDAANDSNDYYISIDATIRITSTSNNKVSGTFSATAHNTNTLDEIRITSGVFENISIK